MSVYVNCVFSNYISRIDIRIYSSGMNVFVWTYSIVTYGNTITSSRITMILKFKMEPHYKLFGLFIINNLWTFQYATFSNITVFIVRYSKRYTTISPINKIL